MQTLRWSALKKVASYSLFTTLNLKKLYIRRFSKNLS